MKTISFTIISKRINYLGINLPKEAKTYTLKPVRHWWKKSKMTQTDEKIHPCSWIRIIDIFKIILKPKIIHRFKAIPIKLPMTFFCRPRRKYLKICMETQKTWKSPRISRTKDGASGIGLCDFILYYKPIVIKRVW